MPRVIGVVAALALLLVPAQAQEQPTGEPPAQPRAVAIALMAVEDREGLDDVRDGLSDGLATAGYHEDENLEILVERSENTQEAAEALAARLLEEDPDVMAPVGQIPAQAAVAVASDVPVVFGAVPDPVGSGLIGNLMNPGGNATGVSDLVPIAEQLALIRQVVPEANRLGIVFDPDDTDSATLLERLSEFAPGAGFMIAEAAVNDAGEVGEAASTLVGEVDAIYFPSNDALAEGFDALVKVAEENRIPLFGGDTKLVARGAVAATGLSDFDVGVRMAELIARVLQGEAPERIAVSQVEGSGITVNPGAAERMGVELAPGLVARATEVIE